MLQDIVNIILEGLRIVFLSVMNWAVVQLLA